MSLGVGETIKAEDHAIIVTAGEALSANDALYISATDGKAYKTDADDLTKIGFVGFASEAASINTTVNIKPDGVAPGFVGLTVGADYYLSGTAGAITATKPSNFKVVGRAVSSTAIWITTAPTVRRRVYTTTPTVVGSSTTQFEVTNPSGSTFRYTWDGTGTDPAFSLANNPIGSLIIFQAQNLSAGNNGTFVVTGAGANYVEVTNASGVAEVNKTIGSGYVARGSSSLVWTKPGGLIRVEVEVVGGGGKGGDASSGGTTETAGAAGGGGGGYAKETILAGDIAATVGVEVCPAGTSSLDPSTRRSSFGLYLYATGGANGGGEGGQGGAGGLGSGGDENIAGQGGGPGSSANTTSPRQTDQGGTGGSSQKGGGAAAPGSNTTGGSTGGAYGGGGSGACISGANKNATGGDGAAGVVIVTEFY